MTRDDWNGKILLVSKDEDVRLFLQVEGCRQEALIVFNIGQIVYHFVRCVDGVWPIGADLDRDVVRTQDLRLDHFANMRWPGCRKKVPRNRAWKQSPQFVNCSPCRPKRVDTVLCDTSCVYKVSFVHVNSSKKLLECRFAY